jgi:thioredoxin reductase
VGDGDDTLHLALRLSQAGVRLAGVVTGREDGESVARLKEAGIALFHGHTILRARGGRWLDRLEFRSRNGDEADLLLDCQACALEAPAAPAYELAHHAGCRVRFDSQSGYTVRAGPDGRTSHACVFAAGHCAGASDVAEAMRQGEAAGLSCALSLKDDAEATSRLQQLAPKAQT